MVESQNRPISIRGRNGTCSIEFVEAHVHEVSANLLVLPPKFHSLVQSSWPIQEDLRESIGSWITKPLSNQSSYRQVLVWQDKYERGADAIFSSIIALARENCEQVVIPIEDPDKVVPVIKATQKWIKKGLKIHNLTLLISSDLGKLADSDHQAISKEFESERSRLHASELQPLLKVTKKKNISSANRVQRKKNVPKQQVSRSARAAPPMLAPRQMAQPVFVPPPMVRQDAPEDRQVEDEDIDRSQKRDLTKESTYKKATEMSDGLAWLRKREPAADSAESDEEDRAAARSMDIMDDDEKRAVEMAHALDWLRSNDGPDDTNVDDIESELNAGVEKLEEEPSALDWLRNQHQKDKRPIEDDDSSKGSVDSTSQSEDEKVKEMSDAMAWLRNTNESLDDSGDTESSTSIVNDFAEMTAFSARKSSSSFIESSEEEEAESFDENDDDSDSSFEESKGDTQLRLLFCQQDAEIADAAKKYLQMLDRTLIVTAQVAAFNDDWDMEDEETSLGETGRVIALITPNYVRDAACIEQFNEILLLSANNVLQPILVKDTVLPRYMQLVQYHDARPGRVDKVFHVLSSIVFSDRGSNEKLPQPEVIRGSLLEPELESFHIFLSYASKHRAQANAALDILRYLNPQLKCFIDVNELQAGGHWQQKLYRALDNSKLVMIILTPAFVESSFCFEEAAISALRAREGLCKLVAVESIALTNDQRALLPKEVRKALKTNETVYQVCQRAIRKLDQIEQRPIPSPRLSTHYRMDKTKRKSLIHAQSQWKNLNISQPPTHPKIHMVGHDEDQNALQWIRESLVGHFANPDFLQTFTPRDNLDSIDSATVLLCILSRKFLGSPFCMNALNIGILRNRSEGGYLIPIIIEDLPPAKTPTFVRLLPSLQLIGWKQMKTSDSFHELIASVAMLAAARQWKDRTTLVPARKLRAKKRLRFSWSRQKSSLSFPQ